MSVALRVDREGQRGRLVPSGPFDLAHAATVASAVENAPPDLEGCRSIDVELASLDRIDGAGAVLLAHLLDVLDARGHSTRVVEATNPEAARLIALYRAGQQQLPATPARPHRRERRAAPAHGGCRRHLSQPACPDRRQPVTGEAYLLLDRPDDPPPPLELGFKPDRALPAPGPGSPPSGWASTERTAVKR